MSEPNTNVERRLLFIIHRGWIEARELAGMKKPEQLYDLADAMHSIPAYMSRWRSEDLDAIRFNLETYCQKYPDSAKRFQYIEFLDQWQPPDF